MMLFRLLDKIIFAALLMLALQLPELADHYRQYLQGYFDATAEQVEDYRQNARENGYRDLNAMIAAHLGNSTASVRTDALQKQETMQKMNELSNGVSIFENGNLFQQSVWMFNPARQDMLKASLDNFVPGIPLKPTSFLLALVLAILTNLLIATPVYMYQWRRKRHMSYLNAHR